MKLAFTTLLTASLLSTTALANTFESQHRVGLGFSSTDMTDDFFGSSYTSDWGNGIKLEYGYEFNQIVGLNVSYAKNKDSVSLQGASAELDGTTFQIDADIGYKFMLDGFAIKPYGVIGLARYNEEISTNFMGTDSWNDTSFVLGAGVRADIGQHFYSDIRIDLTSYDDGFDTMDYDQFSFTVGYKF
ncbi:porin family protein [Vibrio aquaticus]|uniref:Porin family protein n=1 Tax=Vibrio aquaticus TaxID=2496559 RepID=A0A3S0QCQ1_9VIBR|nr:porin family protein [Vibrio aquaticus]RTZ15277.1 porin family protein [Vibrio aquaticus]